MKLTCEICGGELQMNSGKEGAVCTKCGVAYSIDRLKEMLGTPDNAPTAKAEREQISDTDVSSVNSGANAVRYIHVKRKFDLHICKMAVVIDGEQIAVLRGAGKITTIPISQGEHKIFLRIVNGGGIVETEEITINVGNFDFAGEVGLVRGALKAAYVLKLVEIK